MANLPESATYDAGVYQLELTDPVQGGSTGVSNAPLKNLANRTAWLKSQIDGINNGTIGLALYARLASPTFTGSPAAPTAALGDNTTKLATTAFVQNTLGGVLSKSIAGGVNVTLTAVEAGNGILVFTGALTASISVIVPTAPTRPWVVFNNTTGAFTLTVKTASGTGVAVPQGKREIVYCDGTNVAPAFSDFVDVALEGVPTAPTAATGTSTTQVATTAFVNAEIANDAAPKSHVGETGAAHGVATTSVNGFMSSADKTKLNAVASGAAAVGSTAGAALAAAAAAGTATTAARSDHVHPFPTAAQVGAAAASHTHAIANISDWPTAVSMTEVGYLDGVTSAIQTQLNGKQASLGFTPLNAAGGAMSGALYGKPGSPGPNNPNNAGFVFDFDSGLFSPSDGVLQLVSNGLIKKQISQSFEENYTQIRVPKGAPDNSNASANAGYAFGGDGDTGFFAEGGDNESSSILSLRIDGNLSAFFKPVMSGFAQAGWTMLPSGAIIQWGRVSVTNVSGATAGFTFYFPISFPNNCYAATAIPMNSNPVWGALSVSVEGLNLSNCTGFVGGEGGTRTLMIMAIGY